MLNCSVRRTLMGTTVLAIALAAGSALAAGEVRVLEPGTVITAQPGAAVAAAQPRVVQQPDTTVIVVEPVGTTEADRASVAALETGKARVWVPAAEVRTDVPVADVRTGVRVGTTVSPAIATVQPVGEIRYVYVDPRTGAVVSPSQRGAQRAAYVVHKPVLEHNRPIGDTAEQEEAVTFANGGAPNVAEPPATPVVLLRE